MAEKICFVISPIGKPDSSTRKTANDVYDYVIRKAVEPLGYTAIRADVINESGLISPQIIQHLKEDDLVIAYLAEDNPNVFFELAIRYVTKKPYIQLKEPSQQLPFDIKDTRTIELETTEPKSVDEAIQSIKEQIGSLGKETPNPIILALDSLFLEGSLDPVKSVLGEIISFISETRKRALEIGKLPADQESLIRALAREDVSKQIQPVMGLLYSPMQAFKTNEKLPIELKEEVKKIEKAYSTLILLDRQLTGRLRGEYLQRQQIEYMKKMSGQNNQASTNP